MELDNPSSSSSSAISSAATVASANGSLSLSRMHHASTKHLREWMSYMCIYSRMLSLTSLFIWMWLSDVQSQVARERPYIEMTPQAKGHPLFPMLDFIACGIHSQNQRLSAMEVKISKLDSECQAVRRVQEELYQLMQQTSKKSFNLKEEGYEVTFGFMSSTPTAANKDAQESSCKIHEASSTCRKPHSWWFVCCRLWESR